MFNAKNYTVAVDLDRENDVVILQFYKKNAKKPINTYYMSVDTAMSLDMILAEGVNRLLYGDKLIDEMIDSGYYAY